MLESEGDGYRSLKTGRNLVGIGEYFWVDEFAAAGEADDFFGVPLVGSFGAALESEAEGDAEDTEDSFEDSDADGEVIDSIEDKASGRCCK